MDNKPCNIIGQSLPICDSLCGDLNFASVLNDVFVSSTLYVDLYLIITIDDEDFKRGIAFLKIVIYI